MIIGLHGQGPSPCMSVGIMAASHHMLTLHADIMNSCVIVMLVPLSLCGYPALLMQSKYYFFSKP